MKRMITEFVGISPLILYDKSAYKFTKYIFCNVTCMFRVIQNNANLKLKSRFTFVRIHEKYLISKLFRRIYQIKNVKIYIHVLENYKK